MSDNREAAEQQHAAAQGALVAPVDTALALDPGFTGKYTHGLDGKGRLIIPVVFRAALGEKFAVCPSPDFRNIAIYPLTAWIE